MRTLRVLTIGHSYIVGLNRAVMARVAREPGIEMTIAAPRRFQGDLRALVLDEAEGQPYQMAPLDTRFTGFIHAFYYKGLGSLLRPGAFDVVHAWEEPYILAGYQIARAAQTCGARYFFRTAQSLPKPYPPPFNHFENYSARAAVGWVAGGHSVKRALENRKHYPKLGEVITLAADEDRFQPDPIEGAAVRRKLGLEGPVIGFVGRLTAAKGLKVLMEALERTPGPWNLLALGSGPYDEKLRHWARRHGLADRVRVLLAKHAEVPSYLRAMDMLVAPSQTTMRWKEQFGRMIIEAFATGIPVIGSDSGEIPHVISDAGLVVPEADPAAWSEAIGDLLQSPDRRRQLGEAGMQRFHDYYTASSVARKYLSFYQRIMAAPRPLPLGSGEAAPAEDSPAMLCQAGLLPH